MKTFRPGPSGCHHCGLDERLHFNRWSSDVGWHTYTPPTTEQIKTRMAARRTAQTTNTEKRS